MQLSMVCFVRTAPNYIQRVRLGPLLLGGKSELTIATLLDTANVLLRAHHLPRADQESRFRGFWFGESALIEDHAASVGKERRGFVLVAVEEAIIPFVSIASMTADIIADPVFADLVANARTRPV